MVRLNVFVALAILNIIALYSIIVYLKSDMRYDNERVMSPVIKGSGHYIRTYDKAEISKAQALFQEDNQQDHQDIHNCALSVYKNTASSMGQISDTLLRISRAYAKKGKHDDAIAAYKAATNLKPSSINTFVLL